MIYDKEFQKDFNRVKAGKGSWKALIDNYYCYAETESRIRDSLISRIRNNPKNRKMKKRLRYLEEKIAYMKEQEDLKLLLIGIGVPYDYAADDFLGI